VPGRSRGDGERAWAKPVALVTAAMLLVVGAAVAWQALRRPVGGLGAVRRLVTSNGRFDTGSSGAATFARIGNELLADAKRCQGRHAGPSRPDRRADGDVRCIARFQAAAAANVTAVALLQCTQPGVFEARRRLLAELDAIAAVDRDPTHSALPPVPAVPHC